MSQRPGYLFDFKADLAHGGDDSLTDFFKQQLSYHHWLDMRHLSKPELLRLEAEITAYCMQ